MIADSRRSRRSPTRRARRGRASDEALPLENRLVEDRFQTRAAVCGARLDDVRNVGLLEHQRDTASIGPAGNQEPAGGPGIIASRHAWRRPDARQPITPELTAAGRSRKGSAP
jgi:hypothetical protein